jgi:glutaconate CoA-transferase, subunit B
VIASIEATRVEMMAISAAREFTDANVAFVGTGLPMVAAFLARATHAPNCVLVFESGIIDAETGDLATGVGDFRLMTRPAKVTSLRYALGLLQAGRIDLGFLGAAEIDPFGNVNSTVIGTYQLPAVRLPGSGGANDIASMAKRTVFIVKHERRKFVERLSYLTTPGFLGGRPERDASPLPGPGPIGVITDLGVFTFDRTGRLTAETLHPGVSVDEVREQTGFKIALTDETPTTAPPDSRDLELLRTKIDPDGTYLS